MNLREQIETDLKVTLEGDYGLPVILITPDGETIDTSLNDPIPDTEEFGPLLGQILYDTVRINPDSGDEMVVNNPVVSLRRTSLIRIPEPGEKWIVKIPIKPNEFAAKADFIIDQTRSPEGGSSIGFIRLYLRRAAQS